MIRRSAPGVLVAFSMALAACGGSDDATPNSVEITLITTTTAPSEEPVFVPTDEDSDDLLAGDEESDDSSDATGDDDGAPSTDEGAGSDGTDGGEGEATVSTDVGAAPVESTPTTEPAATAAPDATETSTPAEPEVDPAFSLNVDGIGATSFGADPEGTIRFVSNFFGAPTLDTGWVDPFEIGPCSGTELRQVSWGAFQLEFGDVSNVTDGRRHFYAYTYGIEGSLGEVTPPGLSTPAGITAGSSVAALVEAYPAVQLRSADDFIAPNFFVNQNLSGRMSGLADSDVVEVIIGGIPCIG